MVGSMVRGYVGTEVQVVTDGVGQDDGSHSEGTNATSNEKAQWDRSSR
jgi:hypothetical protein